MIKVKEGERILHKVNHELLANDFVWNPSSLLEVINYLTC